MITAITRRVGQRIDQCELVYLGRQAIDVARAEAQHAAYEECLRGLGVEVISLEPEPDLPDSVFVEDPAVVLDELIVMTRMGAASRWKEAETLGATLVRFRPLRWMSDPGTLEGGDVMRVGRTLFVGESARTNAEGIRQLREFAEPFGYRVRSVAVRGCMHLKTGCCYLGDGTVLMNRAWIDTDAIEGVEMIEVPVEEPWGANVLAIGDTVIMPDSFPGTQRMLARRGWKVRTMDVSELLKAEAGVTCMSLILEAGAG